MTTSPRLKGAWTRERVERHLHDSVLPLRLSVTGASGFPMLVSLWYVYADGCLWCAVQEDSRLGRRLRDESRCAFEVAVNDPPYYGVRGQGQAKLAPERGREILQQLMDRYLGDRYAGLRSWLEEQAGTETAICIMPVRWTSWDFTQRMQG